ncbi:MAG: OstA-like protein [Rikenellaceae bacterium]
MRKILSIIIIVLLASSLFGQVGKTPSSEESAPKKELIDIKANLVYPHKLGPDSTVLCLVGNFAAQHNGAVITADSAVRYGDDRIDCFGNVLINKNTTYAYADRAVYNGAKNEVTLYSLIIKVIDEDVTLYTYGFTFNTLDNIGTYSDGGVAFNKDSSRLESIRGYYYADTKDIIGVEDVEIYTSDYEVKGDSVRYNMQNDYAEFFENTNIWTSKGEYLYTDAGNYDKSLARFSFSKDGYVLTEEQEIWSDSLEYFRDREEVILRSNIQIDDTTNKILIYSDYAQYWGDIEKVFLTRNPSVVNYDPEQQDSLFMRADTMILTTHTYDPIEYQREAKAVAEAEEAARLAEQQATAPSQTPSGGGGNQQSNDKGAGRGGDRGDRRGEKGGGDNSHDHDHDHDHASENSEASDSLTLEGRDSLAVDSLQLDSLQLDSLQATLSPKELKALEKENARKAKEEANKIKAEERRKKANAASAARLEKRIAIIDAQKARAARAEAKRQDKIRTRMERKGKTYTPPASVTDSINSPKGGDSLSLAIDSLDSLILADSLLLQDSLDSIARLDLDSVYRVIVGYRNTKTFQGEQQSISDSMSIDSRDSTLHLYINPYMWNGRNQISSEVMDIYSSEGNLQKAVFSGGNPIMASEIDTSHYNQVAGKTITSHFVDNALVRNDVDGNVQTIYFSEDENTKEITTMVYVESGSATFYFVDQELEGITYRAQPSYTFYPLDLIPESQPTRLEGFVWNEKARPTRRDFMDRVRRPSIRTEKEALLPPQFPIQRDLFIDIENLVNDKIWMDRTDVVNQTTEEWLESLGFKSGQPRTEPIR